MTRRRPPPPPPGGRGSPPSPPAPHNSATIGYSPPPPPPPPAGVNRTSHIPRAPLLVQLQSLDCVAPPPSRGLKATTGIVGLEVDPHARETVQTKAKAVLDVVKVIDANVQYRKNVEATFGFWLKQARALLALLACAGLRDTSVFAASSRMPSDQQRMLPFLIALQHSV